MELTWKSIKMKIVAAPEEEQIYSYSSNNDEVERACIGHLRGDFGADGREFWTTWWPHKGDPGPENAGTRYKELDQVVAALRENGLLKDSATMNKRMARWSSAVIKNAYSAQIALCIETKQQLYYLRCNPLKGDYNFYLYMYDKPLLMEVQRKAKNMPVHCFTHLKSSVEPIRLTYGMNGYLSAKDCVDDNLMVPINKYHGASKAQIAAMEAGAMRGWHIPEANPKMYDEQGLLINERNVRTQNEQSR